MLGRGAVEWKTYRVMVGKDKEYKEEETEGGKRAIVMVISMWVIIERG